MLLPIPLLAALIATATPAPGIDKGWVEVPQGYKRTATLAMCQKLFQAFPREATAGFKCIKEANGTYSILIILPENRKA